MDVFSVCVLYTGTIHIFTQFLLPLCIHSQEHVGECMFDTFHATTTEMISLFRKEVNYNLVLHIINFNIEKLLG